MRRNIKLITQEQGASSISELLERFPIQTGTVELLGYLQIAHDDGHTIDREQTIELTTVWEGPAARRLRLPNIIFLPELARRKRLGRDREIPLEITS
jgi:hypothetical protein